MSEEFKKWREIERFKGVHVIITEKIHGSNAQVHVYNHEGELKVLAASRTRYLDAINGPENFGFAAFVREHEKEIIEKLGFGRHYGEWTGPGINSSYNLTEKRLVLFNHGLFGDKPLPPRVDVIPILYNGAYTPSIVDEVMEQLRTSGSKYSPGFMQPEGIVINFPEFGTMVKKVFKAEETGWTKAKGEKSAKDKIDHLEIARPFLQPIRLEKLLMRDETFKIGFPKNLPIIVRAYLEDLDKEKIEMTAEQLTSVKKKAYEFVKEEFEKMKW